MQASADGSQVSVGRSGITPIGADAVASLSIDLKRAQVALDRARRRQRRAEQQVATLLAERATVQESERRRIARDIHDHLGQDMTALSIHLQILESACAGDPVLAGRLIRVEELADRLDRAIDGLAHSLRPPFPSGDLTRTVRQLASDWSHRFACPAAEIVCECGPIALDGEVATHVCSIVQEALHNVARHARASHVRVSMTQRRGRGAIVIADDGEGFDLRRLAHRTGALGLIGMRERAALAGCALRIRSAPGRGTTIELRLPSTAPRGLVTQCLPGCGVGPPSACSSSSRIR